MSSTKNIGNDEPARDLPNDVEGFGTRNSSLDTLLRGSQNLLYMIISPEAFSILFSGRRRHGAFWHRRHIDVSVR